MRNSFSLSVHFLLVNKSDVIEKTVFITASKMKLLIQIFVLILISLIDVVTCMNDHFNFPIQHRRTPEGYSTEGSHYLPPESHTSMPYIPMKNMNNLPYSYLPATVTKAPMRYPSPYPLIISSTLMPFDDEEENEHENDNRRPPVNQPIQRNNHTEMSRNFKEEKRELKPKPMYQPIDRIDSKTPMGFSQNIPQATPRNFIIGETKRSDAIDQFKAAGFQGPQYIPAPGLHNVFISSTTEPAIPIIRLSNEMDLDGSFSYEALGADQTHYVQHSRMENMGTDKEEQVVEGSYSYVGDNGQTYTVHYVADSNGFRASGDHLPVAPPVPEIIQRAVQYNLAEEAKKPPHLKSWNYDENESEREYQAPPKNLFTGRNPEAFSFAFSQPQFQNPQNNLASAASSQVPIKTNPEFKGEQMKNNNNGGPIAPQVTFLASQGAHSPSHIAHQPNDRVFINERSAMPQLMNYEAANQESDEKNKGLWRWQYGVNANNIQHSADKNSISRSSKLEDDVILNFKDLTAEQYADVLKTEFQPHVRVKDDTSQQRYRNDNVLGNVLMTINDIEHEQQRQHVQREYETPVLTTEIRNYTVVNLAPTETWYSNNNNNMYDIDSEPNQNDYNNLKSSYNEDTTTHTAHIFIEKDPITTTQKTLPTISDNIYTIHNNTNKYDYKDKIMWTETFQSNHDIVTASTNQFTTTPIPAKRSTENVSFQDFLVSDNEYQDKSESSSDDETQSQTDGTVPVSNPLENNIFLRNILKTDHNRQNERNKMKDETQKYLPKIKAEVKFKSGQVQVKANPFLEIQSIRKPLDAAEILNFITDRNHFESAKTKPNKFKIVHNVKNQKIFNPNEDDDFSDWANEDEERSHHKFNRNSEELGGIIKNYKTLQRNKNKLQNWEQLQQNVMRPARTLQQSSSYRSSLPPLGRAGPTTRSYLPPIYV